MHTRKLGSSCISISVCDYCVLFVQVPVMFILHDTNYSYFLILRKMRKLWLVAALALINPNMAFYVYLGKQKNVMLKKPDHNWNTNVHVTQSLSQVVQNMKCVSEVNTKATPCESLTNQLHFYLYLFRQHRELRPRLRLPPPGPVSRG